MLLVKFLFKHNTVMSISISILILQIPLSYTIRYDCKICPLSFYWNQAMHGYVALIQFFWKKLRTIFISGLAWTFCWGTFCLSFRPVEVSRKPICGRKVWRMPFLSIFSLISKTVNFRKMVIFGIFSPQYTYAIRFTI